MQAVGRQAFTRVTLPIAAVGAAAVKSFADFDSSMNQSLAIMGDVSDAMRQDMANAAREMAKETVFSASQAAESYFFLASAGLDAEKSLKALPIVAGFAQAGMFDMATATDLLTDAQSALGLTVQDAQQNMLNMERVGNVLVKANTLANASVQQFSEALTNEAAAAARSYGVSLEETTAVLAAFADQGNKGLAAGSDFARLLRFLITNANDNADAFRELGVEVFDQAGNLRPMADIIEQLTFALDGMSQSQKSATLEALGFQARFQGAILPLLGMQDAIRDYQSELMNAGGAMEEVSNNQLKSFSAQLGIAKDRVMDAAIGLGETLAPMVLQAADFIANLIEKFNGLSPAAQKNILIAAGLAAAIGPLLIVMGAMANGLGAIIALFVKLKAAGALLQAGMAALRVQGLALLANPVGLVIAAVAALIAILVLAWNRSEEFREAVRRLMDAAMEAFSAIWEAVQPLIDTIMELVGVLIDALSPILTEIINLITMWVDVITPVWTAIAKLLVPVIQLLAKVLVPVIKIVAFLIKMALVPLRLVLALLAGDMEQVKEIFAMQWQLIRTAVSRAWEGIKSLFSKAKEFFQDVGKKIMLGLIRGITSLKDRVKDTAKNTWEDIKQGAKDFFKIGSPSKLFEGFGANVMEGFRRGMEKLKDVTLPNVKIQARGEFPTDPRGPGGPGGPALPPIKIVQEFHDVQDLDEESLMDKAEKRFRRALTDIMRRGMPS